MKLATLTMAWRNIWRNKRRTLITGGAVGLGLALMIFSVCWAEGLNRHMINTVTRSMLGHAQVHAAGYRQTREPELTIANADEVLARVERVEGVLNATPRLYAEVLLAIGDRSEPVIGLGFDPLREAGVTNWSEKIVSGAMPSKEGQLAIGRTLAEKLEVEVGSRIVLTAADIFTGELNYRLVTVTGILFADNPVLDKRTALMPLADVQHDTGLPGGVHEIALALAPDPTDREALTKITDAIIAATGQQPDSALTAGQQTGAALTAGQQEGAALTAAPWQELVPMVASMVALQGVYMAISLALVFFLISFGIVNTMSMSLMERFREFGIMRAIGTPPGKLAALILAEASWLGVVGSLMGLALGLSIFAWFAHTGIAFGSQTEAMGVGLESPIHPVFAPVGIALSTAAFLLLTPLVSAFVAWRAASIDPVRALRHE